MSAALPEVLFRLAKAIRNYRRPFRLAIGRRLRRPLLRVEDRRSGLRFDCLCGADRMAAEAFHLGLYDIPLVPVRAGDLVLDIGANHGFVACHFARRGAEVRCFEPHPRLFSLLQRNLELNGLAHRVLAEPVAVLDRDGELDLFASKTMGGGMSSLYRGYVDLPAVGVAETFRVRVRSIHSILSDLGGRRVRLLKLDCEGSEWPILRSLGAAARAGIDSIALEYHPEVVPVRDLVELLLGWGDFSLSKPAEHEFRNFILHAARREAILEATPG